MTATRCAKCRAIWHGRKDAKPGAFVVVKVHSVTIGADGKTYIIFEHSEADNLPSLRLREEKE